MAKADDAPKPETMIAAAIAKIAALASSAELPVLTEIPGDPRKLLLSKGDELKEICLPPPLRDHKVFRLEDLRDAAERCPGQPILWHDHSAVVLVTDDADRRERYTLRLTLSEQFRTLAGLTADRNGEPRPLMQPQLIRLLKHDLAGAIPDTLLLAVRKITFRRSAAGESDLQHGRESLGRQVENAVSSAVDLPEYITASVSIYSNPGLLKVQPVRMSLEIEPATERFFFRPLPDAIELALQESQQAIHDTLESLVSDVKGAPPVVWGTP